LGDNQPMISRPQGIASMLFIATVFASNHIAARFAFDDGLGVTTAVTVRSIATAACLSALIAFFKVPINLSRGLVAKGIIIGTLIAWQSFCLYSAVARIPVALALLVFNTFPIVMALMSWLLGGEQPKKRTWIAMPIVLMGLTLALDVIGKLGSFEEISGRWKDIGPGVLYGLMASLSFATALFLTSRWMKGVDGRVRALLSMSTVSVIVLLVSLATTGFAFPHSTKGWVCLALLSVFYGSAFTALFVLLPKLGTANNTVLLNFEPIAALVMGFLILGQTVTSIQMLGAVIVMGAIAYLSLQ
jgi:drug/metabolite transporter (DMT)-like permease